jgi:hypothetical protein
MSIKVLIILVALVIAGWCGISLVYVPITLDGVDERDLRFVLSNHQVSYKSGGFNQTLVPLKVMLNRSFISGMIADAQRVDWYYAHSKMKYPCIPCAGKNYQGIVFLKGCPFNKGGINLSCEDVKMAEQILQVADLKQWHINRPLSDYYRQYVGSLNSGHRMVNIELSLKGRIPDLFNGMGAMKDAGDRLLNVAIDLSDGKLLFLTFDEGGA